MDRVILNEKYAVVNILSERTNRASKSFLINRLLIKLQKALVHAFFKKSLSELQKPLIQG